MKITHSHVNATNTPQKTAQSAPASDSAKAQPAQTPQDVKVQTGPLADAQHTLQAMPDVDMARVAEMKAALQKGELKVDVDALSGAMMAFHRK